MADAQLTAPLLLRSVGLLADGPAVLGRPFAAGGPGVFIIELPSPPATAPIELTRVGKWIERVPTLRLDGGDGAPTSRAVAARLASFWIPSTTVLYLGSSTASIAGRVAAIEATTLGDRRPHSGGHWLKVLLGLDRARVWWARTDASEEYEDALFAAFAEAVPAVDRERLHDPNVVLPFANLRSTAGDRKAHGLSAYLVPEDAAPRPATRRVHDLPPGDAEGASGLPPTRAAGGTTRRAPKPRPGPKPATRTATTAPSPTDPTYLSVEGIAGLRAELEELTTVRRPEVIARIRTAKELGDLRENADYTAAREEQSFLEGRVQALEDRLRRAVVVDEAATGRVMIGSVVRIETDGDELTYTIVGSTESDPAAGRLSSVSPVGAALLGAVAGADVEVRTPRGPVRYRVLAVD